MNPNIQSSVPVPLLQSQEGFKLPPKIPITYVWFGKSVPEDYLISLSELDYPIIFLKNPEIPKYFNREIMDIQKSDYYRLQYLYDHGGIYSDFDNTVNHSCLMKLLQPYRTQDKLVFMTDGRHTRALTKQMTTNLIFAPYPKMPILKKMLDSIDQTKPKVWDFAGMRFVGQFSQPVEVSMDKCVKHSYDWSWFDASNEVLNKKNAPHKAYIKKLYKKAELEKEKVKLEHDLQIQRNQMKTLYKNNKLKSRQNDQLKDKIKQTFDSLSFKYPQMTSKAAKDFKQFKISFNMKEPQKPLVPQKLIKNNSDKQVLSTVSNEETPITMNSDKFLLETRIKQLEAFNRQIQFERDMYSIEFKVSGVIILILILVGFLLLRKRKTFNKVNGDISNRDISQTIQ